MKKDLKHDPKTYILCVGFACFAFATMETVDLWEGKETLKELAWSFFLTVKEGIAFIAIIAFWSFICYLILKVWIADSKNRYAFWAKYIFICIVVILFVGVGISSWLESHPY